ncbi:triose-phosphate isomerase, partial [Enterococcus hirae]|nr:triose-phosphate isomerase [Enterococcus hirae]
AEQVRLIYGGSVSQETVGEIVNDPAVDGVFVGRFGHDPKKFSNIVQIVKNVKKSV